MKNKNQKQGRGKKHKKIIVIFFIIIAIVVTALSPLFGIENIDVSEVNKYNKEDISDRLNSAIGVNGYIYVLKNIEGFDNLKYFFVMRAKSAEDKLIFDMPYLKDVEIKFEFPSTLNVTFEERKPAFLIDLAGTYICSDYEGVIVDSYTEANKVDLPLITGISIDEYKIGNEIKTDNSLELQTVKELFKCIGKHDGASDKFNLSQSIEIVDVSEYNEVWLFIGEKLKIKLGDTEGLDRKISLLSEICSVEQERIDANVMDGTLDFTVGPNPIFIPT